jgi:hypothetical protein
MFKITYLTFIISVAVMTLGVVSTADANSLYFQRVPVRTSSEATCYRFASDVARALQFRNVRSNSLEVAGEKNGVYLSTTCIGRGQNTAMAVVMATSPAFEPAKQIATEFANRLKGIICFDLPC